MNLFFGIQLRRKASLCITRAQILNLFINRDALVRTIGLNTQPQVIIRFEFFELPNSNSILNFGGLCVVTKLPEDTAEHKTAVKAHLKKLMDTNHDNRISWDEFEKGLDAVLKDTDASEEHLN
jgi:hypothetical protein